jgi:transposase
VIDKATVFEIHKLSHENLSTRKIAEVLKLARATVRKYLKNPIPQKSRVKKSSKLDPYKQQISNIIAAMPNASAVAVHKLLIDLGFEGKISIVRKYLFTIHGKRRNKAYFGDIGHLWMLKLLQGKIKFTELAEQFRGQLGAKDIDKLRCAILYGTLKHRNRAIAVLAYFNNIPRRSISRSLFVSRARVCEYIKQFSSDGVEKLTHRRRNGPTKCDDSKYIDAVFAILHAPPSCYGINRTTWRLTDIHDIMAQKSLPICQDNIRKIIRNAGYRFRKARRVLHRSTIIGHPVRHFHAASCMVVSCSSRT